MDELPQPFLVKVDSAEPPGSKSGSSAGEATKYLRETAKWIVGGIIATAGAVLAGSSLTNLGSLDPVEDRGRLGLAVLGLALGFLSIGMLMAKALGVFKVSSISLERLAAAEAESDWALLRAEVVKEFGLAERGKDSLKKLLETPNERPVPAIKAMLPYFYVRSKFASLLRWLPWTVLGAVIGFGLFAWAANPPDPVKPPSEPPAAILY